MTVNRDRLELFYSISSLWRPRDQRLLAGIGNEFELAEYSYMSLYEYCVSETDSSKEKWSVDKKDTPRIAILARAFIDHSVRTKKLIKTLSGNGPAADLAEAFFQKHISLFHLRNAIHHSDDRLETGSVTELLHPVAGDFSWKAIALPNNMDVYWISFGPLLDQQASPTIKTSQEFRYDVDHLLYRAHDHEAHLGEIFTDLCALVENVHDLLLSKFDEQLQELGLVRGGEHDDRAPFEMNGRMRMSGVTFSPAAVSI